MEPIQWKAYEYEYRERPKDWFWAVGIVALSLAIGAILINNILLAILIIVGTVALTFGAIKKPVELEYEITPAHIKAGEEIFPYRELKAFGINEEERKLFLKSKHLTYPLIIIPLADLPIESVREMLEHVLREEDIDEPLAQKFMEYLGF